MFDALPDYDIEQAFVDPSAVPDVRVFPSGDKWSVVQDGAEVALCRTEERARELAFSIVSAAIGFRERLLAEYL
jgi:hypothetical protein